ncbi:MAG: tRNA (adenosine(37)-N6)-threonylcarbamoyltransferase complex transferase subunit TsaD, partial [Cyclobacteriaceae bacterium]|nr:tRNA (adenosine(37)-N6)-threonylcarbamoyltransferase complex transferase subunit TsaD [Cyclobacteriaceae bacterium HetDA_MAG_MS6]
EMLMNKLLLATRREHINRVAIAGGVSANKGLRTRLKTLSEKHGWEIFIPKFEYCTDNAAMIAISGHFKFLNHERGSLRDGPLPRMTF